MVDFFLNLKAAPKKSEYFLKERGWLDLLGSIPSLGVTFKYSGLFRLARLSRFARITAIKDELATMRQLLEKISGDGGNGEVSAD